VTVMMRSHERNSARYVTVFSEGVPQDSPLHNESSRNTPENEGMEKTRMAVHNQRRREIESNFNRRKDPRQIGQDFEQADRRAHGS
jgi:hypothetical protein